MSKTIEPALIQISKPWSIAASVPGEYIMGEYVFSTSSWHFVASHKTMQ